jgi:hypothetical protein
MVAKAAEKACAAAINYLANIELRSRLMEVLDQVAALASPNSATCPDHLHDLFRQIGIWVHIVRYRIGNAGPAAVASRQWRQLAQKATERGKTRAQLMTDSAASGSA